MKALAFGEILYDRFESDSKIGGAPLNFAAHLVKLGGNAFILSAVGNDKLGHDALKAVQSLGVKTDYILNSDHATGVCNITYNRDEPMYDLSMIGAYDNIKLGDELIKRLSDENFDILYFGTLARRSEISKRSFDMLINSGCFKKTFFDMNLRQSYYTKELIMDSLKIADIVKINRDEFESIKAMQLCKSEADLCEKYNIELLLLTLDKDGMKAYDAKTKIAYNSDKPKCKVVSTVGAGDASSACFLYNYLDGEPLSICIRRANMLGDFTVTHPEAIPEYPAELLFKLKSIE